MTKTIITFFSFALAAAAFTACDDDDGSNAYAVESSACVDRINEFRATLDLPALARWEDAETCANDEARQDSESGTAHGAFGQCDEYAQNECPGWPSTESITEGTASCLQMMWDEGPGEPYSEHGHYINMTNTSYTEVACGFYTTPDGAVWAVQDFR
jgi:uncharacterized protein YkwD